MIVVLFSAFVAGAESAPFNSYTNHAGNVVAGCPVGLTATHVTLAERITPPTNDHRLTTNDYRLTTNDYQLTTNDYRLTTTDYRLTTTYPLSIFPKSEQRRIAADFVILQGGGQVGLLRIPVAVKRAIAGADKAMARSRKRAEKGFCTKEESDAFCERSESALKSYLDKQVKEGVITPAERKAIGH